MGGKRPDQYQIAPGEATRTDYKWTDDAEEVDLKSQEASRNRVRARGRQRIPPKVPNPLAERVRAAEKARERHVHGDEAADE